MHMQRHGSGRNRQRAQVVPGIYVPGFDARTCMTRVMNTKFWKV